MSLFRTTLRLITTTTKNSIKNDLTIKTNGQLQITSLQLRRNFSQLTKKNLSSMAFQNQQQQHQQQPPKYHQQQQQLRTIVSQEITKNIQLLTHEPRNVERDQKTLQLKNPVQRPLVVMFSWLQAKQKHLAKYAEIYTNQGYDVLVIMITPWQLMWPVKGSQIVAGDVIKFLHNNPSYGPLFIHGFSVGGYVFGECLVQIARDIEKYTPLVNKFVGQVWDSAADISEIHIGVPKAMFPTNLTLQKALRKYMIYHMKTFHEPATSHYIRSSQMFHSTLVKAPALFFLSKTDPIGAVGSNTRVKESWESMGMKCEWKCWDKSPHVLHYTKHKDEYLEILFNFLQSLNIDSHTNKIRAKL